MVRFIIKIQVFLFKISVYLHSNMVRFIIYPPIYIKFRNIEFTFQYG